MDMADKSTGAWEAWLDRFSHACVELVLSESLFSSEELGDNRELSDGEASLLEQRYARLLPDAARGCALWIYVWSKVQASATR